MITPRFSCTQTEEAVVVTIYCPSIRASEVEIHAEGTLFSLHVNPYFLRLSFSGRLLDDEESSARYDASSGYLTVALTKEVKGQEFEDLDLLAKLLAPRSSSRQPQQPPMIEVVGSQDSNKSSSDDLAESVEALSLNSEHKEILEAAENDWQLPQSVPESSPELHTSANKPYGFLDMHSGYFVHVAHTENEVNELGADAESCSIDERRRRRLEHENQQWDEEHYMADFADDEYIQALVAWKHPVVCGHATFEYTEEEKGVMLRLPRKEYLASPARTRGLYLTLLTVLFAYAYETRTTQCDPSPESAWTISTLIPAFCALDPPPYGSAGDSTSPASSIEEEVAASMAASYRRALAFPLYRSWLLAEACRSDVAGLLSQGRRTAARCLLELKRILDHHEVYYVYSKIWIDDFCVWIQADASDEALRALGRRLQALEMDKKSLGWELEALEAAARDALARGGDSDDE